MHQHICMQNEDKVADYEFRLHVEAEENGYDISQNFFIDIFFCFVILGPSFNFQTYISIKVNKL